MRYDGVRDRRPTADQQRDVQARDNNYCILAPCPAVHHSAYTAAQKHIKPFDSSATLCVSMVFTDFRCPSIRLSRWWILSIRLKTSLIFLFGPVDRHFNFLNPCADTQFQGNPVSGGEKYTAGAGKIGDFRRKSPFISDTVRDNHG